MPGYPTGFLPFPGNASRTIPEEYQHPAPRTKSIDANLHTHCIYVDFLVEIIEQRDSLNNHGVDLIRRELQFEPNLVE
jgi:hypothetical protein